MKALYDDNGILISTITQTLGGPNRLFFYRAGDYVFRTDKVLNVYGVRAIKAVFKSIGLDVQENSWNHIHGATDFHLTDKKQKFEFILKYGKYEQERRRK